MLIPRFRQALMTGANRPALARVNLALWFALKRDHLLTTDEQLNGPLRALGIDLPSFEGTWIVVEPDLQGSEFVFDVMAGNLPPPSHRVSDTKANAPLRQPERWMGRY